MTPLKSKLSLFGRSGIQGNPPAVIHEAAASAFTAAYQLLWASPKTSYFTQQDLTISVLVSTASYTLPDTFLKNVGPTTLGGITLIEVEQEAHFDRPALIGLTLAATGTPRIFFIDGLRNTTAGASDLVSRILKLKPTPTTTGTLSYKAATKPPTFTAWDLEKDSANMPAPAEYLESVILPIAVRHMSRNPWFPAKEAPALEAIEADYQVALGLLDLLNPATVTK